MVEAEESAEPYAWSDVQDATQLLKTPKAPDDFHDASIDWANGFKALSPGAWVMDFLKTVLGVDPGKWIGESVVGDWKEVAKCADMFKNLSDFYTTVGENIAQGAGTVPAVWQGKAADAATQYFKSVANAIGVPVKPLAQLHDDYMAAAHGAWEFEELATETLGTIIDLAIIAALAYAAGGTTSETGVGAVVGGGIGLGLTMEILDLWENILIAFVGTQDLVKAIALSDDLKKQKNGANTLQSAVQKTPIPSTAYRNKYA